MNIHEVFELHYADQNDTTPEVVKSCRLENGSYNNLPIARAFRYFRAGFKANDGGKLRVIGYMSKKGVQEVGVSAAVQISQIPTKTKAIEVLVKEGEFSKGGV